MSYTDTVYMLVTSACFVLHVKYPRVNLALLICNDNMQFLPLQAAKRSCAVLYSSVVTWSGKEHESKTDPGVSNQLLSSIVLVKILAHPQPQLVPTIPERQERLSHSSLIITDGKETLVLVTVLKVSRFSRPNYW